MKTSVALAFGIFLLIRLAGHAEPQQDQESYRISVNVNLVVLYATVRDRDGHFVSDLREQSFEIYEDGVRQPIRLFRREDVPVTVGLVVDHSGSMRSKLPDVVAAARSFVKTSNAEDRMFVINFNEKVTFGLPHTMAFSNRSEDLELAISKTPATGMTALYDATVEALKRLQAGVRDKSAVIVISDGGDNASKHKLTQLLQLAGQSTAVIYAIGVFDKEDPERNPGVLNRLARATGGEAYFPGQLNDVVGICERIARDIRNQYTIGYVSTSPAKPGAYRSIRVVAGAAGYGKLVVRARAGYIAGEPGK